MRLFVSNLPLDTPELHVWEAFQNYGEVTDVYMVRHRETQKFRGFAFVTMATTRDAMLAIQQLHKSDWKGRRLVVTEADERPPARR